MVASHGGSPSGRLTAVVGRLSPDLVVGRCVLLAPDVVRDLGVAFLDVAGGAEVLRVVEFVVPLAVCFLPLEALCTVA